MKDCPIKELESKLIEIVSQKASEHPISINKILGIAIGMCIDLSQVRAPVSAEVGLSFYHVDKFVSMLGEKIMIDAKEIAEIAKETVSDRIFFFYNRAPFPTMKDPINLPLIEEIRTFLTVSFSDELKSPQIPAFNKNVNIGITVSTEKGIK